MGKLVSYTFCKRGCIKCIVFLISDGNKIISYTYYSLLYVH